MKPLDLTRSLLQIANRIYTELQTTNVFIFQYEKQMQNPTDIQEEPFEIATG